MDILAMPAGVYHGAYDGRPPVDEPVASAVAQAVRPFAAAVLVLPAFVAQAPVQVLPDDGRQDGVHGRDLADKPEDDHDDMKGEFERFDKQRHSTNPLV